MFYLLVVFHEGVETLSLMMPVSPWDSASQKTITRYGPMICTSQTVGLNKPLTFTSLPSLWCCVIGNRKMNRGSNGGDGPINKIILLPTTNQ